MNSPYMGKFRVSQKYKGAQHDGLDLVGIDSKEIHSTVNGTVVYAGWENSRNQRQGFGQYVKVRKSGTNDIYYFGHLSKILVKTGDEVKITDVIGIEGSTGRSTGSHLHYCMRINGVKGQHDDICEISGIPNAKGTYDDGYRPTEKKETSADIPCGNVKFGSRGDDVKWVQIRLNAAGFDCGAVDGICGEKTEKAVREFQEENGLTVDGIAGKKTNAKLALVEVCDD